MTFLYKIEKWESAKWTETGPLQDFRLFLFILYFIDFFILRKKIEIMNF